MTIFAHLRQILADDEVLIPEKVSLSAVLVPYESADLPDIPLGQLFELNRELAERLEKGASGRINWRNCLTAFILKY